MNKEIKGTNKNLVGNLVLKVGIPATVAALFLAGCGGIHTNKVEIYGGTGTPNAATATPKPSEAACGTPEPTKVPTPNKTACAPKPTEAPTCCTPRPIETPVVTPRPTEIPNKLKTEYGDPIGFKPGETRYVSYGSVISGDVKVNDIKIYDDLAETGLIIRSRGNLVKIEAPYGASGRVNLKGQVEIDAVVQQQAMATFGSHPEMNKISVYDVQAGQITQVFIR